MLSSEPELVSNVQVTSNLGNSDHNMILFTTHLYCSTYADIKEVRDYKQGNYVRINECLSDIDWDEFMSGSTEVSWAKFKELLLNLVTQYVPTTTVTKKRKFKKPIWMTHKAVKLVGRKRRIFHKYKDISHPAVKAANKAAKSELKRSLKNFEKKLAQNTKTDRKSFFAYIRSKTKSKVLTGPLTDSSDNILDSPDDMVTEFNSYFASVFTSEDVSHLPNVTNIFCGPPDDRCHMM